MVNVIRVIALSAVLVLVHAAWTAAAPRAGADGHAAGQPGGVEHGAHEHWGDRNGLEAHLSADGHRGWPVDGYSVAPYPQLAVPQYWYYRASVNAYERYVAECPEGWQPIVP